MSDERARLLQKAAWYRAAPHQRWSNACSWNDDDYVWMIDMPPNLEFAEEYERRAAALENKNV